MDIKEVKDLIREILQSDITEFELEHTGTRVRLSRKQSVTEPVPAPTFPNPGVPPAAAPGTTEPPALPISEEKPDSGLHFITSPIVGTFYRTPSPGSEPYVKIGDMVEEGVILCVVEAMKLMNEIPSDVTGEVVRIYVENSHPVEYGQRLFGIRPRK